MDLTGKNQNIYGGREALSPGKRSKQINRLFFSFKLETKAIDSV